MDHPLMKPENKRRLAKGENISTPTIRANYNLKLSTTCPFILRP
jgi:hypothetical protein